MLMLLEYLTPTGQSPYRRWFDQLDEMAAARIAASLARLASGNVSQMKGLGSGVSELKIDFGPGYRVYFGRNGETLVILLGGGTKKRQSNDIASAKERWADYKRRKRES